MKKLMLILCLFTLSISTNLAQGEKCATKFRAISEKDNSPDVPDHGRRFIIRVVFHVLYNNQNENVSNEKLEGLLRTLNADFRSTNPDLVMVPATFTSLIGRPNTSFELATELPDRASTTGIIRKEAKLKSYSAKRRDMFKESPHYDSKHYLNIYVLNIKGETTGFHPTESANDALVIDFLKAEEGKRTLTHETGHWLNLEHIFGGDKSCDDDGIGDTPLQNKHGSKSCLDHPRPECRSDAVMFMNFMDYTKYRHFFSVGQVETMRQHILKTKPNIATAES